MCASLTEDRYGVVQRDTPKIMEAMLSFLSAIEEYQAEINILYTPPSVMSPHELQAKATLKLEVDKAGDVLGMMSNGMFRPFSQLIVIDSSSNSVEGGHS